MERNGGYNLIHQPWLPVRRHDGAVDWIRPGEITSGIRDNPVIEFAWPRPDFDAAAQEFLIGLLSTAAAPDDEDEWEEWWHKPPDGTVLQLAFKSVDHAFWLDGDGARFMQDYDTLEGVRSRPAKSLLIDAPGEQTVKDNKDLFVRRDAAGTTGLGRPAAAMALHTLNTYSPTGGAGHRTSMRGGGPMTTLVVPRNGSHAGTLWGRLWANVETADQSNARGIDSPPEPSAIFPWLAPTRGSGKGGSKTTPQDVHPLHAYWGMPRRIRLVFEEIEGFSCGVTGAADSVAVVQYRAKNYGTNYSDGFEHPLSPYYRDKKAGVLRPVHPQPDGITYRLWPALVQGREGGRCAQTVRHWNEDRAPSGPEGAAGVAAFGYDMDNMKSRNWVEGEMPLLRLADSLQRDRLEKLAQEMVAAAEKAASELVRAVRSAAYVPGGPGDYGFIRIGFFRATEGAFYAGLRDALTSIRDAGSIEGTAATRPAREAWQATLERAAVRLFDERAPLTGREEGRLRKRAEERARLIRTLRGTAMLTQLRLPAPTKKRRSAK